LKLASIVVLKVGSSREALVSDDATSPAPKKKRKRKAKRVAV